MYVGKKVSSQASWLGLPAAVSAFASNIRLFGASQVGTPLRVLSWMAISASLKSRGLPHEPKTRQAVLAAMELGALLNDHFDGDSYDAQELRRSLRQFAATSHRATIRDYIRRLATLERKRPASTSNTKRMRSYRENVNRLSLALLWAIASDLSLQSAAREMRREADLQLLFRIVMLAQVIDDILDVGKDRLRCLPSLATAPDATSATLRKMVPFYSRRSPLRLDENFALHLMLRLVGLGALAAIAMRSIEGTISES